MWRDLSGIVRSINKRVARVIKSADRDTQIVDGKVGFRNVTPMPEGRAATAECRITEPLIDGFRGPFSALARAHSRLRPRWACDRHTIYAKCLCTLASRG